MRGREELQAASGRAEVLERKLREAEALLEARRERIVALEGELSQARAELRRLGRLPLQSRAQPGRGSKFNLIELMIVLAILGVLGAIASSLLSR